MALEVLCTNCSLRYPEDVTPYRCPRCTGIFDYSAGFPFELEKVLPEGQGLWRYRHAFGLPDGVLEISLGEGNTPLVEDQAFGRRIFLKLEYQNPTGSYKDRGSAVLASFLVSRGVSEAVEDSSGNAGASFAAYAARARMKARIFVPESASGPKRQQIAAYGAEIHAIQGPRSIAAQAVREAANKGIAYASHAYLPYGLAGYATIAYEIVEQLGQAPGSVIVPAGMGNLILAVGRGFEALKVNGVIDTRPALIGVQARACAPIWAAFHYGQAGLGWVTEGETLAEGVRVRNPLRGDAVIAMVESSGGTFIAVDEEEIISARDELATRGFYVEPTSAIVWKAAEQVAGQTPDPIVAILTGSGLKARN